MNSIHLFFSTIKASIKQNPIIHAVFLLFYIFSTVVAVYVFGKHGGNISVYDNYDNSLSTFSVDYGSEGVLFSEISDMIGKNAADENVGFISLVFKDEILDDNAELNDELMHYDSVSYAKNESEMVKEYLKTAGLTSIDADTFIDFDDTVIVVESILTDSDNETFEIQGHNYIALKRVYWGNNGISSHLVPYKAVVKNNPMINEINVKYNSITDYTQLTKIKDSLSADFRGAAVSEPVQRDYSVESIFSMGNILVYLVIILSAVNFIYIYRFILEKRSSQYRVYFLCGCSNRKIFVFTAAEILLISIVQTFMGILLFQFAIKPFIVSLEPNLRYAFGIELYSIVFVLSVIISFVILTAEFILIERKKGAVR